MSSVVIVTFLSSFLASAVEFVEAITVVLAVGVTRQWRSTHGPIVALAIAALATSTGWASASGLILFGLVVAGLAWGLVGELAAIRASRRELS